MLEREYLTQFGLKRTCVYLLSVTISEKFCSLSLEAFVAYIDRIMVFVPVPSRLVQAWMLCLGDIEVIVKKCLGTTDKWARMLCRCVVEAALEGGWECAGTAVVNEVVAWVDMVTCRNDGEVLRSERKNWSLEEGAEGRLMIK